MTRIFHTTDLHASEIVWKKTLKSAEFYKADAILLLGDLTGKAIVPIVQTGPSEWYSNPYGDVEYFHSREEVKEKSRIYRDRGFYVFETTESQVAELKRSPLKMNALFTRLMCETMNEMLNQINSFNFSDQLLIVVCPGNDDITAIDDIIRHHERAVYPLGRVIDLDSKHAMISCEYVNPTPWETPRECSEEDLEKRLQKEFDRVPERDNLVCNFHAPPYGSGLDVAPKLDKNLKPVTDFGRVVMENVGSRAVRSAILQYQPLLGLHGHIHESHAHCVLGRTVCVNPGSEYQTGIISGYVIDLPDSEGEPMRYWRVTG